MIDFTKAPDYWSYEGAWGELRVEGKVVVDIGADNGSSAWYFLERGAAKVIAYESNPELRAEMKKYLGSDPRVEIHGAWNGQLPDADVLKMDCDGCEEILTKKHLDPYRQWAVAIHLEPWLAWEHFKRLRIMLQAAGARLHWQTPDGKEQVYLKA